MILYERKNNPQHATNVRLFRALMQKNNDIKFFQPDPLKAPWHVKAEVNGVSMNFWPHLLKGNIEGHRAVTGSRALQTIIGEARNHEDEDLIE